MVVVACKPSLKWFSMAGTSSRNKNGEPETGALLTGRSAALLVAVSGELLGGDMLDAESSGDRPAHR